MEQQYELINNILRQIYEFRRKKLREEDHNQQLVEMVEKYNRNNEYFCFEIKLLEMFPGGMIYHNKFFPNLSPQEIFIGFLKGNGIMTKYREFFLYETKNINLFQIVTPNLNKNLWYVEKDLVLNGLLTVYCCMNLTDMKNMLKMCPEPTIYLSPATYKIDDPETFVELINKLDDKVKKSLNFIPFLRSYSRYNTIKPEGVYYTYDKIKLIDKSCFL